jgi:hypothetical protein
MERSKFWTFPLPASRHIAVGPLRQALFPSDYRGGLRCGTESIGEAGANTVGSACSGLPIVLGISGAHKKCSRFPAGCRVYLQVCGRRACSLFTNSVRQFCLPRVQMFPERSI